MLVDIIIMVTIAPGTYIIIMIKTTKTIIKIQIIITIMILVTRVTKTAKNIYINNQN